MTVAGSSNSSVKSFVPAYAWMPALIALITIIALAIGSVGFRYLEGRLVASTGETLAVAASEIANKLDLLMAERYGDIKTMGQDQAFQGGDRAAMTRRLTTFIETYPVYQWMGVTDARGRIVAATNPSSVGQDRSGSDWFRAVRDRGGIHVQDARGSEDSGGTLSVSFTAPIRGPGGAFLGAVTTRVGLPVLEDAFAQTTNALQSQYGTGTRIEYQFLRRDGTLIADSLLREEKKTNLNQLGLPSARLYDNAPPGYVEEMHLRRHVPVVTGYAQTERHGNKYGLDWGILVRVDREDILAPANKVLRYLMLLTGLAIAPMLVLLLWATTRLRKEWATAQTEAVHAAVAEAQTRLIINTALDAIISMDANGLIAGWNPQAEAIFGWSRTEVVGRNLADTIIPPQYREAHARGLKHFLATGQGPMLDKRIEITALHRDGREFPVELTISSRQCVGAIAFSAFVHDITGRKQAEEALQRSRDFYLMLFDEFPALIWRSGTDGKCDYFNKSWLDFTGHTMAQEKGDGWAEGVHPEDRNCCVGKYREAFDARRPFELEYRLRRYDGEYRAIVDVGRPYSDLEGHFAGYIGTCYDITERKHLEEQLRQSQKMEAVGQLAGGIAHDFNNMLTVINGYSQLLLSRLESDAPHRAEIEEINTAGTRAAALTRQLLAFSRKQVLAPRVLTLNAVVTNLERMLQRLIGEDIALRTVLQPQLGCVLADPGQIEQVIMNLAVNARDAMPQGGRLTIETTNVEIDESYTQRSRTVSAGPHVMLAVSDTGYGMDKATQAHVFEPFFTTKEKGKGTGLGLATVYGIIKQSGGSVWVYSEPGRGTTFKIYLPLVEGKDEAVAPTEAREERVEGSETILVAEDDGAVRKLTVEVLRAAGYRVLEAATGPEVIALGERHQGGISLLVTDVVMPGMDGRALAERLIAVLPGMKVLYLSGYTDDTIVHHGVLDASVDFLQKPFTPLALARKVREVLDEKPAVPTGAEKEDTP